MLTSSDIVRVDLLKAEITNRPTVGVKLDTALVKFELSIPDELPNDPKTPLSCRLNCEMIVQDQTDDKEDSADQPKQKKRDPRWRGHFRYGFQIPQKLRETAATSGFETVSAIWPFIRCELNAFAKQSVDVIPLPFQLSTMQQYEEDEE